MLGNDELNHKNSIFKDIAKIWMEKQGGITNN